MTELDAVGVGEAPPPYMIFLVVFLFFLTGLFGFLICHLLKKKGYRCRAGDLEDEDEAEKQDQHADDDPEENQDTVEQILKCIIENEANMEAFNEMLGNHNVCVRHDPRLRRESVSGAPPHHHTVHSGADINSCHLCAQVRSKKGRRQSRTPRFKQRPGEQTVLSVGRFRVTHTDKKPNAGPNPLADSGNQLDQSQDSEDQKEGVYNLRSMFKDNRQPADASNDPSQNVGKRRKSVTIFGLRRGSDPVGNKTEEEAMKDGGRFFTPKQSSVQEEPLNAESFPPGVRPSLTDLGLTSETKTTPPGTASVLGFDKSPASPKDNPANSSDPVPDDARESEACGGRTSDRVPGVLPIPSAGLSARTFGSVEKGQDVDDLALSMQKANDPGPVQTSTPIAPGPGHIAGLTPEPVSDKGLPVAQTPPERSSDPDLKPEFGPRRPTSAGTSPSSLTSTEVPTSPLAGGADLTLSSRNSLAEASGAAFSAGLQSGPDVSAGQIMSSVLSTSAGKSPSRPQNPSSAQSSGSKFDGTSPLLQNQPSSPAKGDVVSSFRSPQETDGELAGISEPEANRVGVLETETLSPPVPDLPDVPPSSPCNRPSEDPASGPSSSSSLPGRRRSHANMIHASSDSNKEFSVAVQDADAGPFSLERHVEGNRCQERDDMVQMEDIKDCKVAHAETAGTAEAKITPGK